MKPTIINRKIENKINKQNKLKIILLDCFCLINLLVLIYLILCLSSFSMDDASWSRSIYYDKQQTENLGGVIGAYIADILYYIFGFSSIWIIIYLTISLYKIFTINKINDSKDKYYFSISFFGLFLLLLFSSILENIIFKNNFKESLPIGSGGIIGLNISPSFIKNIGFSGSFVTCLIAMALSIYLLCQVSWITIIEVIFSKIKYLFIKILNLTYKLNSKLRTKNKINSINRKNDEIISKKIIKNIKTENNNALEKNIINNDISNNKNFVNNDTYSNVKKNISLDKNRTSTINKKNFSLPPINLLNLPIKNNKTRVSPENLEDIAKKIEFKLGEFGIKIKVVSATSGPIITRYEIEPAQGVKGSQIVNLNKDLARSLSLQSIRIVETIAGKNTMGIEIPNDNREDVFLREIITSNVFNKAESKLTIALGKDISGVPTVADLAKMPHLLIAGTTGSGKSVAVNAIILSLLYKASINEVKMIMIDPKMLELSIYQDIPHLLCPVITDMKEASVVLNWCVNEMEKRYKLLSNLDVRSIENFNKKITKSMEDKIPIINPFSINLDEPEYLKYMPYIVIIIDELADLMMVEGKKVEQQIARLAQKARAAGIHLILATQRPSVDVITGLIKANIPTRISFQVSSKIDSRTILDQMGAEQLLGKGDMLFLPPGNCSPTRIHGAFVSDMEVVNVTNFLREHYPTQYIDDILEENNDQSANSFNGTNNNDDELFNKAVEFVLETNKTSISSLQRFLRIGFNRAANLMEEMEKQGIVSPQEMNGNRKILIKK